MSAARNYGTVTKSRVPRERLIRSLVSSIQGHGGYAVQTDWRTQILISQKEMNKNSWALTAALLVLFGWIFFWLDGNQPSTLTLLFDQELLGTTIRITGFASPELVSHINSVLAAEQRQLEIEAPASAASELVESGQGHIVLTSRTSTAVVPVADLPPEAAAPSGRARAACLQCECQDFTAEARGGNCTCGHTSQLHGLICLPDRPQTTREFAAMALELGRVLVVGGLRDGLPCADCSLYEAQGNAWRRLAPAPLPVARGTLVALTAGRVALMTAMAADGPAEPLVYDLATDSWSALPQLRFPRSDGAVCALGDGGIAVVGGRLADGRVSGHFELFSPAAGGWQRRPDLELARADASAASLGDGRLLVAGGHDGQIYSSSAEIFTPATGHWITAPELPLPQAGAVAAVVRGVVGLSGGMNAVDPLGVDTGVAYAIQANRWVRIDPETGRLRPAAYGRRPAHTGLLTYMVR